MAKSELTITKSLQELTNLRDALNMAIMAMEIVAAGKEKHREEDPGAPAEDEPDPPSEVKVTPPAVSKVKATTKSTKTKEKPVPDHMKEPAPVEKKEPPGKPKISVRDTIIGMIKAGTSIGALEKMLDAAIKKAAPAGDIFELRQAMQRFNLYDGDVTDILVAYNDHAEEAKEIIIGKDSQAQLPKSMAARVTEIPVGDEQESEEEEEEEVIDDDQMDPDDKF